MKNIFCTVFLIACALTFHVAGAAIPESQNDTTLVVQDTVANKVIDGACIDFGKVTEYDFGQIKEDGGKQSGSIESKNSGNKPLVITKVMVSCRCIILDYPKKPVMPGAGGKITVTYDPKKQKGVFHKAIQVYSNDSMARHIVFVKGEVVE